MQIYKKNCSFFMSLITINGNYQLFMSLMGIARKDMKKLHRINNDIQFFAQKTVLLKEG